MTDLTEQWKQKKLPLGWYFVKDESGKIYYAEYTEWFNVNGWCGNYFEREEEIVEVLAEAPDYIDWRNMVNCACEEHEANKRLIEENDKLKELLKECRNILKEQNFYRNTPLETDTTYRTRCLRKQELLTKIDEVLK